MLYKVLLNQTLNTFNYFFLLMGVLSSTCSTRKQYFEHVSCFNTISFEWVQNQSMNTETIWQEWTLDVGNGEWVLGQITKSHITHRVHLLMTSTFVFTFCWASSKQNVLLDWDGMSVHVRHSDCGWCWFRYSLQNSSNKFNYVEQHITVIVHSINRSTTI